MSRLLLFAIHIITIVLSIFLIYHVAVASILEDLPWGKEITIHSDMELSYEVGEKRTYEAKKDSSTITVSTYKGKLCTVSSTFDGYKMFVRNYNKFLKTFGKHAMSDKDTFAWDADVFYIELYFNKNADVGYVLIRHKSTYNKSMSGN